MEQDIDTKAYFTFDYESEGKNVTLRFNKQDARVPEVLEEFLNFLKACGYCFDIDDYLDVNNDFKYPASDSEPDSEDVVSHEEAEAKAYQQAASWTMTDPNAGLNLTMADLDYPEPETTNFSFNETGNSWIPAKWDDLNSSANSTTTFKVQDY